MPPPRASRRTLRAGLLAVPAVLVLLVLFGPGVLAGSAAPRAAEPPPKAALSLPEVAKGTDVTVSGSGWKAGSLVMLLLCGQNMIGGTNACANAEGNAVVVGGDGTFRAPLPVGAPPKPCPCVVNVSSVNGGQEGLSLPLRITNHPTAPLPAEGGTPRLAVLTGLRLEGEDGVLTWFGAPPERRVVITVGNLGTGAVRDPVFQVGVGDGVLAPTWEEQEWKGEIKPGGKAEVVLKVELGAGAHGDHEVSVKYGDTVLAGQPWRVDRPYGVLLFWVLLFLVVPTALFRIGMAVVDRVSPRGGGPARAAGVRVVGGSRRLRPATLPPATLPPAPVPPAAPGPASPPPGGRHRGAERGGRPPAPASGHPATPVSAAPPPGSEAVTTRLPRIPRGRPGRRPSAPPTPETTTAVLPWFTPDSDPSASSEAPASSAPSEDRPTTKGHQ
ncbi:neocarzinostatin apoprotein domain-containing protein [Streptomyces sp. BI20]|uniref:neocarzinostatin apoprotein domain-containing protein n=1 Tax=Streptomyces sp. BI20 TaxID=3403460 RepID=UPI003C787095